jgi:hypothetical protein
MHAWGQQTSVTKKCSGAAERLQHAVLASSTGLPGQELLVIQAIETSGMPTGTASHCLNTGIGPVSHQVASRLEQVFKHRP